MSDEKTPIPAIGSTWMELEGRKGLLCVTGVQKSATGDRTRVLFLVLDKTSGRIIGDGAARPEKWEEGARPVAAAALRRHLSPRRHLYPNDVLALAATIAAEREARERAEAELARVAELVKAGDKYARLVRLHDTGSASAHEEAAAAGELLAAAVAAGVGR